MSEYFAPAEPQEGFHTEDTFFHFFKEYRAMDLTLSVFIWNEIFYSHQVEYTKFTCIYIERSQRYEEGAYWKTADGFLGRANHCLQLCSH